MLNRRLLLLAGGAVLWPSLTFGKQPRPSNDRSSGMKIEFSFSGFNFTASFEDNASALDLASMLPVSLEIDEDRVPTTETNAGGQRTLRERSAGRPLLLRALGQSRIVQGRYRYSKGLIRLGRLDAGTEPLLKRGKFPLQARIVG